MEELYLDVSDFLPYYKATAQQPKAISPATAQSPEATSPVIFQSQHSHANKLPIKVLGLLSLSFSQRLTVNKLLSREIKNPASDHTALDEDFCFPGLPLAQHSFLLL